MSSEGVTRRMKLQNIVSLKHYKLKRTRCITHFFALVSFHQCFISEVYYTYIPCFVSSSFKEGDILRVFSRCFVSLMLYERGILHISRVSSHLRLKNEMYYAFFRVVSFHQCFMNKVYYTYITCFVSSSFIKERDVLRVFSRCFVSLMLYERGILHISRVSSHLRLKNEIY